MRAIAIGLLGVAVGVLTWAIHEGAPVSSTPPGVQAEPSPAPSDHVICPLAEFIRSQTQVALMAREEGSLELLQVQEGEWSAFQEASLRGLGGWIGQAPSGGGSLVAEIGAGGLGAGIVNIASGAKSGWACGESSDLLVALGGSTLEGDRLDLILYNPYAWDSSAQVKIVSELGEDTPTGLQEVYVPAGKAVRTSVDEALSLRRLLGVQVESSPGRVAMVLQQSTDQATAVVEGVSPHTDWWLPVPDLRQTGTYLVVASPSESSFTYRVDLLTESGPVYGFVEENFLPNRMIALPLSDLPPGVTGLRVSGTVPLVAGLRIESEDFLAASPGVPRTSRRWLLPGAGRDGESRDVAWLLNPSVAPVSVVISAGGDNAYSHHATISSESVLGFDLNGLEGGGGGTVGFVVEAEEEIAVVWTSEAPDGAASYATGVPVAG